MAALTSLIQQGAAANVYKTNLIDSPAEVLTFGLSLFGCFAISLLLGVCVGWKLFKGSGGGGGSDKKTGAVVSMQSFTSAGADTSLSVDDDDFWSKLMPGMKSARGLMSRLNDGAATRDEESKAMFMHELSELVKDVLEAKSNQEDVSR